MSTPLTQDEKIRRGADDSGQYFHYMTEFVGFTPSDAEAIRQSGLIIEKYIPSIVADFYAHLLRYPPTRIHFLNSAGEVDEEYLQKRMHHLTNFWRRTAAGVYDDEYARYIDYVGRAHTSRGADPGIYIAERYVIGQVGFIQHAISKALEKELHGIDEDLERRAVRAWNLLMMVILEMLSRAYGFEQESEHERKTIQVDHTALQELAVETYEKGLGLVRPQRKKDVFVAHVEDIPEGDRKIVEVEGLSIGVFHHKNGWYALLNHCLHRGGPVAAGPLDGDVLTCPWHGFQYNVTNGQMIVDPGSKLEMYPVATREGGVYLTVTDIESGPEQPATVSAAPPPAATPPERKLARNEFFVHELPPGEIRLVFVEGEAVAVYNVGSELYATHNECTHMQGPLNEGELDGATVTCPWHGSCFDVRSGAVLCAPADEPVKTYAVVATNGIARVEPITE